MLPIADVAPEPAISSGVGITVVAVSVLAVAVLAVAVLAVIIRKRR